jgi:hypothetical protein
MKRKREKKEKNEKKRKTKMMCINKLEYSIKIKCMHR